VDFFIDEQAAVRDPLNFRSAFIIHWAKRQVHSVHSKMPKYFKC